LLACRGESFDTTCPFSAARTARTLLNHEQLHQRSIMPHSLFPPVPQFSALSDPLVSGRIQVLLVPVGPVSPKTWDRWSRAISAFGEIKLSDVPGTSGNAKGGRGEFRSLLTLWHDWRLPDRLELTNNYQLDIYHLPSHHPKHPYISRSPLHHRTIPFCHSHCFRYLSSHSLS
jgi:hypothetical protein